MNTSNHTVRTSIALVVVALFLVAVIFLLKRDVQEPIATPSDGTQSETIAVTDERAVIAKEDALSSIAVAYPRLKGFANGAVEEKINTTIKTEAQSLVGSFLANYLEDTPPDAPGKNTISSEYKIAGPARGYVTVLLNVSEFASGAAHPNPYTVSLTFNVATGEKVVLADFFKPASAYLNILSSQSRAMVMAKLGDDGDAEWITTGTQADELNFQVAYPDIDGFHVIFNAYQVAPYVVGATEIIIPYAVLEAVLK
jgi:hypothetical protein